MSWLSAILEILKNISKILPGLWRKYNEWSRQRRLDKKAKRREKLDILFRAYEEALRTGDEKEIEKAYKKYTDFAHSD